MNIFNSVMSMKKLLAIFMIFIIIFFNGCSKEEKFGVEQFVARMNKEYEAQCQTADFMLGKNGDENNYLFYEYSNYLLSLNLNHDKQIVGIGLLKTAENDYSQVIDNFCKYCSVFTGLDYQSQMKILTECDITPEQIKTTDSNMVITVGKYKYSVICNDYSVTLFCDRV